MFDPAFNIFADFVILEPIVCSAGNGPIDCPFMRFVGQVIACVDRRGIAFKFARDGSRTALENLRDFPDRFAFAFKDG